MEALSGLCYASRGKLWQQKENVSCVHGQDVEMDASAPLDFFILFSLQT